jgi:hypothetical protein
MRWTRLTNNEIEQDDKCIICGRDYVVDDITEIYFGLPIDSSGENTVNICGRCINREDYARFVKDDDFYNLKIHEPKQEYNDEQRSL